MKQLGILKAFQAQLSLNEQVDKQDKKNYKKNNKKRQKKTKHETAWHSQSIPGSAFSQRTGSHKSKSYICVLTFYSQLLVAPFNSVPSKYVHAQCKLHALFPFPSLSTLRVFSVFLFDLLNHQHDEHDHHDHQFSAQPCCVCSRQAGQMYQSQICCTQV